MTSISIVGSGNVAYHLGRAIHNSGIRITHIYSRNTEHADQLARELGADVSDLESLPGNQLALICISDDAISQVIERIPADIPVAYTSGSVEIDKLPEREHLGVFYPLQTLSKGTDVDISEVPMLIEANTASFQSNLLELANKISRSVHVVDSAQRAQLHIAAVWINNFTNHLVYQAQEITRKNNLDDSLLLPLLKETVRKLGSQSPYDAQTGPARRRDLKTIEKHMASLEGDARELYKMITKSIQETYRDEKL